MQESYHYKMIARALTLIEAEEISSLDALGERMQMSPAHIQKLFSEWVGISPKRYAQFLKLVPARERLRSGQSVLDTALELGMSGSARLHDLFIQWEAMTPGEFAKKGSELSIYHGIFDSPFGQVIAMGTERGLTGIGFVDALGEQAAFDDLQRRWPNASYKHEPSRINHWVEAAFSRKGEARMLWIGRPFQLQVWEALMRIPSGEAASYGAIATAIGAPKASRAVGTAVGQNPISVLIPCHRVLRASGALGGYHWGLDIKRKLLAWEAATSTGEITPMLETV